MGVAYSYWSGTSPYVYFTDTVKTRIYFNTRYNNSSYNWRLHTACHEIGHALGLGHNVSSDSCLNSGSTATVPNGDDVALTNWLHFDYMPI